MRSNALITVLMSLIVSKLSKSYGETIVFKDLDFKANSGDMIGLIGPSGSGKTTFLHLIGLLDSPTSGRIMIDDIDAHTLSDIDKTKLRLNSMGFIYQFHFLLEELTALENVMIPLLIQRIERRIAIQKAKHILDLFRLSSKAHHFPKQLSGGEQQRVAIARALVTSPKLLLADEPTGNLDRQNALIIFEEFKNISKSMNATILVATHDQNLIDKMDKILEFDHISNSH